MDSDVGLIPITIELFSIGQIDGHIIRYIAPHSADAIIDKMPFVLRGRFNFGPKKYWTLLGLDIHKGPNQKSSRDVERGDIVYNPKTDELIIIIENIEMPNKVNLIGKVSSNLELLLDAKNGLKTKIHKRH
ncbi:hypothetical protein LCGC14_0404910 [marine sediment metagenome]|uniref:Cyclophilin-like domain-containing protein n=1 Tax=marine sediment metagenome TaxID=412755 RepID=A0A0F9VHQ0_9ZZZZ|nr:MAG: hypothetical protein Lokiarch_26870 [Candidatus Lokiarchaeum sp. GC14_75]